MGEGREGGHVVVIDELCKDDEHLLYRKEGRGEVALTLTRDPTLTLTYHSEKFSCLLFERPSLVSFFLAPEVWEAWGGVNVWGGVRRMGGHESRCSMELEHLTAFSSTQN